MAEGGELEDVKDIASKAVSQTCKLALVLHLAEKHEALRESISHIDLMTWANAQALATWFLTESVRVQRMAGEDAEIEPTRRILRWILREGKKAFTSRELQQTGPRPRLKAKETGKVLALLEEHAIVRAMRQEGNRTPTYRVNPNVATVANVAGG